MTFRSVWAVEREQKAQQEILKHSSDVGCICPNILELTRTSLRQDVGLDHGQALPAAELRKVLPCCSIRLLLWCVRRKNKLANSCGAMPHLEGRRVRTTQLWESSRSAAGRCINCTTCGLHGAEGCRNPLSSMKTCADLATVRCKLCFSDSYVIRILRQDPSEEGWASTRSRQYIRGV